MDHHDLLFTASARNSAHNHIQTPGQHADTIKKRPFLGWADTAGKILLHKHETLDSDPQCHIEARHGNMPGIPELGAKIGGPLGLIGQPV